MFNVSLLQRGHCWTKLMEACSVLVGYEGRRRKGPVRRFSVQVVPTRCLEVKWFLTVDVLCC